MHSEQKNLFDHLAIAFLNVVVSFPTGILIWFILNGVPATWAGLVPFEFVYWFVGIVVVLGVFFKDAWLASLYGRIWHFIYRWFNSA